jgi:iron complex outermembrane receptor protein
MRLRFLIFTLFVIRLSAFAFTEMPDTVHLEEITFYGDFKKYQPGAKIVKLTEAQVSTSQEGGVDQLLMRFAPVYIKGSAGGLSTLKIRGTAASHTSINFGGININSLTLGHSNMSAIPTFLFDRFELQYGGSSALNGSGAIGGALYLGQTNRWTNGVNVEAKVSQGSFGEQFYGTKLFLGNGKFESVTRLFFFQKDNNFTFQNKYTGNVEDRTPVADVQHGAAIENKGLLQEFNYLFTENEFFRSSVWLNRSWQQIQPTMQVNLDFKTAEEILDENIRAWGEYKNENLPLKWNIGAGYVHDYELYNNIASQTITTDRLVSEGGLKQTFGKAFEYKLGAKYQYIVPKVYSYSALQIENEQHLDVFGSFYLQPIKKLKATLNLRQQMVSNYKAPFTPSLGMEYTMAKGETTVLTSNANVSRSYRIPTLNDRFWGTQGNPDLKPEDGLNVEAGFKYDYCTGDNFLTAKLNAFYMDVDNWIEWRNFGVWQAQNVQRVVSKGVELQANGELATGAFTSEIGLSYTLNSAQAIENIKGTGTIHQQLTYTPVHIANASYFLHYKKSTLTLDGTFTGERFANYSGSKLKPYFITNVSLSQEIKLWGQGFKVAFSVNNLFNVSYENEKYYAMPGINYRISLSANIQSKQK